MDLTAIGLAFVVLLFLVLCWFGMHYLANPPLSQPDATARLTGNCGDTMEIALQIVDGRVKQTRQWTDGCSVSKQCLDAAALLAGGKTLAELRKINMLDIMELTGTLPDSHLHCAQLAETTLQHALIDYLQKCGPRS